MKKILTSLSTILLLVSSCTNSQENEKVLLPNVDLTDYAERSVLANEIFPEISVVKPETTEQSIFGESGLKVVKRKGIYYIKSWGEDILVFDSNGNFSGKLSAKGNGPGEYQDIYDFDVVPEKDEIWVSYLKTIYIYSASDFQWKKSISLDFDVNGFKYLNDSTILASSNDSLMFKVFNQDGIVRSQYYEIDRTAPKLLNMVPFRSVGNKIAYQLDESNTAVIYDVSKGEFSTEDIFSSSLDFSKPQTLGEYFKEYGFQFFKKLEEDFVFLSTFQVLNDDVIVLLQDRGKESQLIVSNGKKSKNYTFLPSEEAQIENNLIPQAGNRSFITLSSCDSDDSFLFVIYSSDLENEDNPTLLNIYSINI